MATVYGVNFTKYDQNVPKEMVNVAENGGRMRVQYDTYEASALEAGSTISMARMPKGSRIWQVILVTDDLSGTATLSVGDSSDVDRFITASICGDANKLTAMYPKATATDGAVSLVGGVSGTGIDGFGHEYTSQTDIIITTATAAITGTINLVVFYTID